MSSLLMFLDGIELVSVLFIVILSVCDLWFPSPLNDLVQKAA